MAEYLIGIGIGIGIAIIIGVIRTIYHRARPPVSVSPRRMNLNTQQGNIKATVNVQNRNEDILFNVWVKLAIQDCQLNPGDIKITSSGGDIFSPAQISSLLMDYDQVVMEGTNSRGQEEAFFILQRLDPLEDRSFTVEISPEACASESGNPRIMLQRISHSKVPQQLLKQAAAGAYNIEWPRGLRIDGVRVRLERKSEGGKPVIEI
ncbi:MAG: hypothetical protein PHU08_07515 [Dehalococcoidales bacterium]|nr:hypothetical protein [Dehalococcoidales bacterium]